VINSSPAARPNKPRPDFPLYVHKTDRWAKKVLGKTRFFGKASTDPTGKAALEEWLRVKDDLLAGRKPRAKSDGLVVGELCDRFLIHKRSLLTNGEITPRTFDDYKATADRIVGTFGARRPVADLTADDFRTLREKLAETLGFVALGNSVQRVRSVFKFGREEGLLERDVVFGQGFARPSKKALRLARAEKGPRLFEAADVQKLLTAADVQIRAMILLGVNGGMGNSDVASLPMHALDLDGGWLNYPRPKTGIDRRIPLWPETVKALRAVLADRREPKDPADKPLVFVTMHGHSWGKLGRFDVNAEPGADEESDQPKRISSNNSLSKEFRKLTKAAGQSRTFYDLRHTFATIGGGSRDQVAVNAIMGHADQSMAAVYRERIDDSRLRAVVDHVHAWLYAKPSKGKGSTGAKEVKGEPKPRKAKATPRKAAEPAADFQFRIVG